MYQHRTTVDGDAVAHGIAEAHATANETAHRTTVDDHAVARGIATTVTAENCTIHLTAADGHAVVRSRTEVAGAARDGTSHLTAVDVHAVTLHFDIAVFATTAFNRSGDHATFVDCDGIVVGIKQIIEILAEQSSVSVGDRCREHCHRSCGFQ